MKKLILAGILALGMAAIASAQSTITFDNSNADPGATLASTNHGLIFIFKTITTGVPLDQDVNITLLGGPTAGSLTQIASLTFANGLAQGDYTAFGTPGQFADLSGNVYNIPGVAGGGTAFFEIEAWLGNAPDFQSALGAGPALGSSGVFSGATGGGGVPPGPPLSVGDYMPSFALDPTPEPTTLALCGLGAVSLLLFRRKK